MNLLRQWIESLPGPPVLPPPEISPHGGNFDQAGGSDFEKRTGRDHPLHAGRNRADEFGFALRKTGSTDRPTILRAKAFKPGFTKSITAQEIFLVGG